MAIIFDGTPLEQKMRAWGNAPANTQQGAWLNSMGSWKPPTLPPRLERLPAMRQMKDFGPRPPPGVAPAFDPTMQIAANTPPNQGYADMLRQFISLATYR